MDQYIYPEEKTFKTYLCGSRRIDFALAFPETAECITNIVYEPFHYRLSGDHRGFFIDFDEKRLFGNDMRETYDVLGRGFTSKEKKVVIKYLDASYSHLKSNNIMKRIQQLIQKSDHEVAEAID